MTHRLRSKHGFSKSAALSAVLALLAGAVLLGAGTPALAHGRAKVTKAKSGARTEIGFVVEHGCGKSPTVKVAIKVPAGVTQPAATAMTGWTAAYDAKQSTMTWSGGSLAANKHGTFSMTMTMPTAKAGTVLTFPMVQTCTVGALRWIEGPKSKYPAPTVTIS